MGRSTRYKMLATARRGEYEYLKKFKLILDNSLDAIYCYNLQEQKFEYISPSFKKVLGFTTTEFAAMDLDTYLSRVHPDHNLELRTAYASSEITGKAQAEFLYKTKDNYYRWLSCKMSVIKDSERKPLYRICNIRDISDRKENENALMKREMQFRTIVETANEGICQIDSSFRIIYGNEKLHEMLGYPIQQMSGRSIFEFLKIRDLSLKKKIIEKNLMTKGSYEQKYYRNNGKTISTLTNITPLTDNDGEYTGSIAMITDITQMKKFESSLRDTRKKLRMALEIGNIGLWELDVSTMMNQIDDRIIRIFDFKPGIYSLSMQEIDNHINDEDVVHIHKAFDRSIKSKVGLETIFRTKPRKGKIKYIIAKALPIEDADGIVTRLTGVCYDVTELKEGTEKIILKLNEELLRSNKELQSFAYVASHDLQEPLRMVASFTQLLEKKYGSKLDKDAREYIRFAVEGAQRMYKQLNGLLEYSRVHTKGGSFTLINMNQVVERSVSILSLQIRDKNIKVVYADLPDVYADENQMVQLMQNLLSNAVKFGRENSTVAISSESAENYYIFKVKDEGIGIEEEYFDKIFEIFRRLVTREQYEGTGIGLSICKRIVERHGGRIWLESKPGKGSTFFFSIPKDDRP